MADLLMAMERVIKTPVWEHFPATIRYNGLLVKPVFFLRFGGQRLKFQAMTGVCHIFKFTNRINDSPIFPLILAWVLVTACKDRGVTCNAAGHKNFEL
jgi:hypothetical protein